MGNDISTISGPESGVSVSVTVNEGVHVWYVKTPAMYNLIHKLLFTDGARAFGQVLAGAGKWKLCFLIGLEGMRSNVLELDQFLATLLGELNPTVVSP